MKKANAEIDRFACFTVRDDKRAVRTPSDDRSNPTLERNWYLMFAHFSNSDRSLFDRDRGLFRRIRKHVRTTKAARSSARFDTRKSKIRRRNGRGKSRRAIVVGDNTRTGWREPFRRTIEKSRRTVVRYSIAVTFRKNKTKMAEDTRIKIRRAIIRSLSRAIDGTHYRLTYVRVCVCV